MASASAHSDRPHRRRRRHWLGWIVEGALAVVVVLAVARWAGWLDRLTPAPKPPPPVSLSIGDDTFVVELAVSDASQRRGLGGRAALPADRGMLFVYPRPTPGEEVTFWMKDCLIDLDVAFVGPDRRIVTIRTMKAEPLNRPEDLLARYGATGPVQYALEVGGGQLAARGIRVGDTVAFSPQLQAALERERQ